MSDNFIDCCVTSPPYYGLRDYGHKDQIGLEKTPEQYVNKLVEIFREVKRVLKKEGTLWLNLGDSYCGGSKKGDTEGEKQKTSKGATWENNDKIATLKSKLIGIKIKDLIGIPWMVAFALRADGWYLRQDIIWHKPNPMPESVTDRCTKAHEYIFLMSKSAKYYYDAEAIKTRSTFDFITQKTPDGWDTGEGSHGTIHRNGREKGYKGYEHRGTGDKKLTKHSGNFDSNGNLIGEGMANKRSVWTVNTMPYSEAHFATFPENLIIPCIKAGSPENGIVYDPFMGAGTTALVSHKLNRKFIGSEINPQYVKIAEKRIKPYLMQQRLVL
jgi:DNA modification methylase